MGHGDVYLRPDAPDPVLPNAIVLDIARAHTELSTEQVEVDESGGEARAYLLGDGVVVKTQRPHRLRPRTSLAKEALLLQTLAEPLGRQIPHVFGHGYADGVQGVVEYVVMSRIPGDALVRRPANDAERSVLIHQMGELLARLHQVPITPLLQGGVVPIDRHGADLTKRLESRFGDVADVIAQHPDRWTFHTPYQDVVATALAMLPNRFSPVVVDSNLGPTHVFTTATAN